MIRRLGEFGRLVRWMNLVIIILTMVLVRYSIILQFSYEGKSGMLSPLPDFIMLLITTLLITTAGYIINDYFDVRIDEVNRPEKRTVHSLISHHQAIKIHLILNSIAILLGFFLAWRVKSWSFGFIFPFIAGLLWLYSAKYKKALFWGNFIVAALSSFVVLLGWLYEFFWLHINPEFFATLIPVFSKLTAWVIGYSLFAFLVSLVREIIKDMEDVEGDKKYDCKTIPIVAGLPMTRLIIGLLVLITMALLAFAQIILLRMELSMVFWYMMVAVQIPSAYLLFLLSKASDKSDYHGLSILCKIIMFAGILSMQIMIIA